MKFPRTLGSLLGLVLLAAALWILYEKLRIYSPHQLLSSIRTMPPERFLIALALTALNFVVLIGYDFLAATYVGQRLKLRMIAFTSFVSYAFGHNVGLSFLSAGSMRYHLYTAAGVSALNVARMIAYTSLTFWIGYLALGMGVFLLDPTPIPSSLHLPFETTFSIGLVLAVLFVGYVGCTAHRRRTQRIWGWEFPPFSPKLFLGQILVGGLDAALVAGVLFALLPEQIQFTYLDMLGVFLLAQVAGIVSQVPAGIGVFEAVFLSLLPGAFSEAQILGALLIYRGIYYLIPLIIATNLLAIHEVKRRTASD